VDLASRASAGIVAIPKAGALNSFSIRQDCSQSALYHSE